MHLKRNEIEAEETVTREIFAAHIRRLADALSSSEGHSMEIKKHRFSIPASGEYKIKYELEKDEAELSFEIKWRPTD